MANCIFAFPDRVLASNLYTPVLSGGSWAAAYPLANLMDDTDDRMHTYARSTDAAEASTIVKGKLMTNRDIKVVVLSRHNLSLDATVRIQLYSDDNWVTEVHDSTALDVWSIFYPPGALQWGHPALWTGVISEEDRQSYPFDYLYVLPAQVICQSFKVSISDTTNADGYVEFSRCILAPGWQPEINISWGTGVQWVDPSTSERSRGGVRWIDRQEKYRSVTGKLDTMTVEQGIGAWFEMQRQIGTTGEIYFVFDPDDIYQTMKLRSFLCTMNDLSPIEFPYDDNTQTSFALSEVI